MHHVAKALAAQGRGPDTTLVHMAPHEVQALAHMGGLRSLPTNPKTGLPEAGLLSMVLPLVAAYFTGGTSLGWMGSALGGAAGGAVGAGLEGGNVGRGALMGGLGGAMMGASGFGATGAPGAVGNAGANAVEAANAGWGAGGMGQIPTDYGNLVAGGSGIPATQSAALAQEPLAASTGYGGAFTSPEMQAYAPTQSAAISAVPEQASWTPPTYPSQAAPTATASPQAAGSDWWDQSKQWMGENKGLTAMGGLTALRGLSKAFAPTGVMAQIKPHYMAGPATSNRTYTGPTATDGTGERNYFSGNQYLNYSQAPGETRYYADGGQIDTSKPGWYGAAAAQNAAKYAGGASGSPVPIVHTTDPDYDRYMSLFSNIASSARDPNFVGMGTSFAKGGLASLNPMFIHGAGDGMSDSVPAQIDGQGQRPHEPIRVADGEYVVPADAVAHIGNGSSNAGAKKLDGMVSKVRKARTGKIKQAPQINPMKMMPA